MTYTAATQAAETLYGKVFMESLDTLLLAAGFEFIEEWPTTGVYEVRTASTTSKTLTSTGVGLVIDGLTLVEGDKVLLSGQSTTTQNGIWVVNSGAWTRDPNFNADGDFRTDLAFRVMEGTAQAGKYIQVSGVGGSQWIAGMSVCTFTAMATLTKVERIYKSPAAGNSLGVDWFMTVRRGSDTSNVTFTAAEVYDATLHRFYRYVPASSPYISPSPLPDPVTFAALDIAGCPPYTMTLVYGEYYPLPISALGFQYWASINLDRIVIGTRVGTSNTARYIGLYDDALPESISPFPLCIVTVGETFYSGGNYTSGRATREPKATIAGSNFFAIAIGPACGLSSDATTANIYFLSPIPARVAVYSARTGVNNTNPASSANGMRGYLKDVIYQAVAGSQMGDTLTVTDALDVSKTYTHMSQNGYSFWVDQAV